jgi:hypothetical protein
MERVHQDLSPHYDEAHHILNKMAMKSQLWKGENWISCCVDIIYCCCKVYIDVST